MGRSGTRLFGRGRSGGGRRFARIVLALIALATLVGAPQGVGARGAAGGGESGPAGPSAVIWKGTVDVAASYQSQTPEVTGSEDRALSYTYTAHLVFPGRHYAAGDSRWQGTLTYDFKASLVDSSQTPGRCDWDATGSYEVVADIYQGVGAFTGKPGLAVTIYFNALDGYPTTGATENCSGSVPPGGCIASDVSGLLPSVETIEMSLPPQTRTISRNLRVPTSYWCDIGLAEGKADVQLSFSSTGGSPPGGTSSSATKKSARGPAVKLTVLGSGRILTDGGKAGTPLKRFGIACRHSGPGAGHCTRTYPKGSTVRFLEKPDRGWKFNRWVAGAYGRGTFSECFHNHQVCRFRMGNDGGVALAQFAKG